MKNYELIIKILDGFLHILSGAPAIYISAIIFDKILPINIYIGKFALFVLIGSIVLYVIFRFILCGIFKPLIKIYKRRVSC